MAAWVRSGSVTSDIENEEEIFFTTIDRENGNCLL